MELETQGTCACTALATPKPKPSKSFGTSAAQTAEQLCSDYNILHQGSREKTCITTPQCLVR